MPRATVNKLYRTFVKGLITEAGPLTYPQDASINEDNCIIYQAGNRSRRHGVDFEDGHVSSVFTTALATFPTLAVTEHVWQSADNNSAANFLTLQVGSTLHFYNLASAPLSSGLKAFVVDLSTFAIASQDTSTMPVHAVSGKGYLFVVGAKIDPFLIAYEPNTDSITTQRIFIQIRDFKGLDDGLANDEEPGSLTPQHNYNLLNQGWLDPTNAGGGSSVTYYTQFGYQNTYNQAVSSPISTFFTAYSRYPGNNKQWWVAKNATTGAFDATLLGKFYFGNTRAPRGHYVVEAFNIDRSAVSGVGSLPVESLTNRPVSVAFFSGRAWYAIDSTIYFSQILDDKRKAGFCYMSGDPTSEDLHDLIATDGGVIPIPEMIRVNRISPVGGGLLCFASNGLWYISGTNAGFTATDITVTKVSPIGTDSPRSVIHVQDSGNDMILYWSRVGIQAIQQRLGTFGKIAGEFDNSIISQTSIQSFYNNIPKASLPFVKAHYDPSSNLVQWLFSDGNTPYNYSYNRVLNFDLTLKAFYPWTISGTMSYVVGIFDPIQTTGLKSAFTKYVTATINDSQLTFSFALANNTNFADWGTEAFTSFVETGYELLDDAMRNKQAMYVFTYFRRTEDAFVADGEGFDVVHPSSCWMQVKWDWSNSEVSNRWSTKQQAYRIMRVPQFDEAHLAYDNGFPIVVTRNKVRGHGRAIQFRFENNDIGSNFDLLGWAVPYSGNTQP